MSTDNLKKYRYIYNGHLEVPDPWKPIILNMLDRIDKVVRYKMMPRFILNMLFDISKHSVIGSYYLHMYTDGFYIDYIKQKFATLRVSGINIEAYSVLVNKAIADCNNTCEFCGAINTDKVMIKSWVRNLCAECQIKHKNNGPNI